MAQGDYFLLTLPSQVRVRYNSTENNQLSCQLLEPDDGIVESCTSLGPQTIKLVVGSPISLYFQFDVLAALSNPPSTTFTDSVILETYKQTDVKIDSQSQGILIAATNDSFSQLQMQGTVTQYAGDKNTLKFTLKTKNDVLPNGLVQIQFPWWFNVEKENIRQSFMTDLRNLKCMDTSTEVTQTACSFDSRTQTLTLTQIIGPLGIKAGTTIQFTINNVLNPISTDVSPSLTVRTTDDKGGIIDQSTIQFQAMLPNQISNPSLTAENSLLQETTKYTLQFSIGVPMYQGACTVSIYLPYPDFKLTSTTGSLTDVQGIGLFGQLRQYQYQVNPTDNSIIIKDACSLGPILPTIPATIYIIGLRNPDVAKFTDPIRIKIWNEQNGQVAELTTNRSPTFQITVGEITDVSMITDGIKINSQVDFTLNFKFSQQALSTSTDTQSAMAKIDFTFTDLTFKVSDQVTVLATNVPGQNLYVDSYNSTENRITVVVNQPQIKNGQPYYIQFSQMKLAGSRHPMGPLNILLSKQSFNNGFLQYYPVNNGTFNDLIKTTEGKFLRAEIYIESLQVYKVTTYRFQIAIENEIPQKGYLLINLPQDIYVEGGSPLCQYLALPSSCSMDPSTPNTLIVTGPFVSKSIDPSTTPVFIIEVLNIRNPRSTKTTGIFKFQSFDQFNFLIDYYFESNTAVTMTAPAILSDARVKSTSSVRVGDTQVQYNFELKLAMPLNAGDYILLGMPEGNEISLPVQPLNKCSSPEQPGLQCSLSNDKQLKFVLSNPLQSNIPLTLELMSFTNPANGRSTSPFRIAVFDSLDFDIAITMKSTTVADGSPNPLSVQMSLPFLITSNATLRTNTDITTAPIVITIQMFMRNVIPSQSKLIISYPKQLIPDMDQLSVLSPQTSSLNGVTVNQSTRQIIGEAFFSVQRPEYSYLELQITGFKNPAVAVFTDDFTVEVQTSEGFVIDKLIQKGLNFRSRCDYPCKDCQRGSGICDSCLAKELTNLVLFEENSCVEQCRPGFYQIGNICGKCDSNCKTCDISPLLCTACNPNMYLFNNRCVSTCDSGYFRNDIEKICEQCQSPCQSCQNSINTCTTCKSGYYLYKGTCRQSCPQDYFINNPLQWTCDRCTNQCQTCQRTVDQCTSCLPGYKLNTLNNTCFTGSQCPIDVTVEETEGVCSQCKPKCATCGNNNTGFCTKCAPNLLMTDDSDCLVKCKPYTGVKIVNSVSRCVSCPPNCTRCQDGNPEVCLSCDEGLVNHKFSVCLPSCPEGFVVNNKSGNCIDNKKRCKFGYELDANDTCQLVVQECLPGYILNTVLNRCIPVPGLSVPFPFLIVITLSTMVLICVVRKKKEHQNTRLIPTIIVYWSYFEVPMFMLQIAFAAQFEHWMNTAATFVALIFHFIINCYAVRNVMPEKILEDSNEINGTASDMQPGIDPVFKHWALDYRPFLRKLRRGALLYNHKILRLLSSSYRNQAHYQAVFANKEERLTRPLLRIAIANMTFTYLLIAIADVTALRQIVRWGYQFTIFCIESLVFVSAMSILEIADYYIYREKDNGMYFKVQAKNIDGQDSNVFRGLEDQELNPKLQRQYSQDRHVAILKQINKELYLRKLYNGNFDQLAVYCRENELFHSPLKGKTVIKSDDGRSCVETFLDRHLQEEGYILSQSSEEDSSSDYSGKCLSTQGHYRWNKPKFYDKERDPRELRSEGDLSDTEWNEREWQRAYNSVLSETEYGDPQRLNLFREEFPLHPVLERTETPPAKTLDYKASFHILDHHSQGDTDEDNDFFVVQQPPKFNLTDVMGHFETDLRGNFVLVKRQGVTLDGSGKEVLEEYLVDALGRRVNRRGYLVDTRGNIVSKFGDLVVTADLVDPETDDIPAELFAELFIPKQITRNIELLGESSMKKIRRKRLLTGKERKPKMLHINSSHSNFDSQSRGTAHQSKYQRNIVTDEENADDTVAHSSSKKKKKGKKGASGKKKAYINDPSHQFEIPMKRPKISREQQLLGGASQNNLRSNEDLMNEVAASDNEGVGFQITINHAKGIFGQHQNLKKKKKKKAKKHLLNNNSSLQQALQPPQSRTSINREVSANGFTVYGGIRKAGGLLSPSQASMRPGSKNRLIVKDGVVQKESKARSKPRVPAFIRPKPEKMVKKKELEEILASSPDLKEVEVHGDVNILEVGGGPEGTHLSQDEDGGFDKEAQQKRLEIEAKKITDKINMKKEKMLQELEKEAEKVIEKAVKPRVPKQQKVVYKPPPLPIKKKVVKMGGLDDGLYRIHLDMQEDEAEHHLNDTNQSIGGMLLHHRPQFNPTPGFDQTMGSIEGTLMRPDSAAVRIGRSQSKGRYHKREHSLNNSQENQHNRKSSALNTSGRLVMSRDQSHSEMFNLMPAQIGGGDHHNQIQQRNHPVFSLQDEHLDDFNHQRYNNMPKTTQAMRGVIGGGMRSTSLISPLGGAGVTSFNSNDPPLIVHDGRKMINNPLSHHNAQSTNKVSSAYKQDLTQMMKQSQNKLSKDNLYDVDAFAQLRKIFGKK